MKKNKILVLSVAIIMSFTFVACGDSGDSDSTSETSNEDTTATTSEDGSVTGELSVWSWGADEEKTSREAAAEIFANEHPEIELDHSVIPTADNVFDQKFAAAMASGTGPDVVQMSPDYYGLYTEYFVDLNPYMDKDGVVVADEFVDGSLEPYFRPDGKLEGLPLLQNVFALAYNKDMFDEFGVEYPSEDWTWDDVYDTAIKFSGGEGATATYGLVNHWVESALSMIIKGGEPYTDDLSELTLNTQETADGLTLFQDLIINEAMPDDTAAKSLPKEQLFVSGRAAMYLLGGFETKFITDQVGDNFEVGAVSMPVVDDGYNNLIYATGYSMVETSENRDAAWQFLKEVSFDNDDMAKETSKVGMPTNKTIAETVYAETNYNGISNDVYINGVENARLNIWGGALAECGNIWSQVWEEVTLNLRDSKEVIDEYYPSLEKAFDEAVE